MEYKVKVNGVEYVNDMALTYGHHCSGSLFVGEANVEHLKKQIKNHLVYGHGAFNQMCKDEGNGEVLPDLIITGHDANEGVSAWLKVDCKYTDEVFASLENYPVLDDEMLSKVETEALRKSVCEYVYKELSDFQTSLLTATLDITKVDEVIFKAYQAVAEEKERPPVFEDKGIDIGVEDLLDEISKKITVILKDDFDITSVDSISDAPGM